MTGQLQLDDKLAVWIPLAGPAGLGLQRHAPRRGARGKALQRVGEAFALVLDVKHVAVARRVAPGRPLPGAQALPRVGDRIVGIEPLRGGIQQVHAPRVGVSNPPTMLQNYPLTCP